MIVTSDLCLIDILTLGCINRIVLAMLITEQIKFIEGDTLEENRAGGFEETFQTVVIIRDMADHIMKHTQCGQFLLSGYAFWISVTIK